MAEVFRKARPAELKTPLLTNPGKGCATFQRFNGDPLNEGTAWSEEGPLTFPAADRPVADHYLPSTVSYCRWFWEKFEPREGQFDWSMVAGALRTARERGQTLQVRLQAHGSTNQPQLPAWYQERYPVKVSDPNAKGSAYIEALYDGPEYFARWGRVIEEFGKRFDGHPALEAVDIAFIGPWGEGAGECSKVQVERFIDKYIAAHPQTTLLVNNDGYQFQYGIAKGLGWRCDCYGDLRQRTLTGSSLPKHLSWNHTFDMYPMQLVKAQAQEIWKTQPVVFETCGVPLGWYNAGFDLDLILQQGLKFHMSVFMPKSNSLPDAYMTPLAQLMDRCGYRFVFRQAKWDEALYPGADWSYAMWIENTGVAPIYRDYTLAFRIQTDAGEAILPVPETIGAKPGSSVRVRSWLPGDQWIEGQLRVPENFPVKGPGLLSVGLIDPKTGQAAVRFANENADGSAYRDNWLVLDKVVVG